MLHLPVFRAPWVWVLGSGCCAISAVLKISFVSLTLSRRDNEHLNFPGTLSRVPPVLAPWKRDALLQLYKIPFYNTGSFAFVDGPYKAQLDSPLLPWQPFHKSVGLCLRFNYLMPAKSKPTLKVYLRDTSEENLVLIWNLTGNHGEKWSAAQVAWPGAGGTQVRTEKWGRNELTSHHSIEAWFFFLGFILLDHF